MAEEGQAPTLFTQNDTGEYEAYTPPTFQESLPEDVRDNEQIREFEKPGDLASAYLSLHSNQPVVPETPDAYAFEPPEGIEVDLIAEDVNAFKQTAHELGLTQQQFENAISFQLQREQKARDAMLADIEKNRTDSENALKMEWGDKYDENVEAAKQFYKTVGAKMKDEGKALFEFMENTKFGDNPHVVRFMAACASLISDDAIEKGSPRSPQPKMERSEAGDPMLDTYDDMKR